MPAVRRLAHMHLLIECSADRGLMFVVRHRTYALLQERLYVDYRSHRPIGGANTCRQSESGAKAATLVLLRHRARIHRKGSSVT